MFVFWESKRQPGGRRWQRGAQGQPVDYVAFFLLVRVTWFGSLLATGANLCGQRAGIDKTWSPLRSLSVAPLATRRYKLLNTFPSCTVPRVRQEICTGDLASNGAMPQRFWTHARLRYVGGITGEVWVELTAAWYGWACPKKFLLAFKLFSHKVWLAELCFKRWTVKNLVVHPARLHRLT